MKAVDLPENPSIQHMLDWIGGTYKMGLSALARMFQTNKSTVHYWMKTGNISFRKLQKVRKSFYYLNNSVDPHSNERKCSKCEIWLPVSQFRYGKTMCRTCEYKSR